MTEDAYRALEAYLQRYEKQKDAEKVDPYEEMLDLLSAPYNALRNYDEFLAGLKEALSPEEAELWRFYPEYTIRTAPKTVREISAALPAHLRPGAEALSRALARKGYLMERTAENGEAAYLRIYFYDFVAMFYFAPDDNLLTKAAEHWWYDLVERGDSAMLRQSFSEHRVMPHEGALTGDSRHGKIPMHLEIPDARTVLPMDKMEESLRHCNRFALMPCVCRTIREHNRTRTCDYPLEVCIGLNQAAENAIEMGLAREISMEEALAVIRRCRDLGMTQIISNAEHPLFVCNCCKCCCLAMRTMARFENIVCGPSRYEAEAAHPENCVACGKCAGLCPVDAVVIAKDGGTYVKAQQCVGCGVCVSQCPKAVLKLRQRPGAPDHIEREYLDRVYI